MSRVLKKGAPSRSYPSRQRKLGPAPFASFEDLSDELESPAADGNSSSSNDGRGLESLPELREGEGRVHSSISPEENGHRPVTATSSGSTNFGQTASGLQTPSTPRIDISCASSSTPPSEDSTSEKELFQGGLGYAFREEGTEELRSSTEELDLGEVDLDSEEEKRKKREEKNEELKRRSSHPANMFYCRRKSSHGNAVIDREDRKPSLFLDGLRSRPAERTHSFGSGEYSRPDRTLSSHSAHSSGSIRGRSPSPHKLMLETSFCGKKPIPTASMDIPDDSPPLEELQPSTSKTDKSPTSPLPQIKDKAIENLHKFNNISCTSAERERDRERSLSIKSLGNTTAPSRVESGLSIPGSPLTDRRPSASSTGSGRRSVSPFKMVYETSFCGSKPIPTRSMDEENQPAPPKDISLAEYLRMASAAGQIPPEPTLNSRLKTTTAQIHLQIHTHSSSSPPKSSDHWRPITPKSEGTSPGLSPNPVNLDPGDQNESLESSPSISNSNSTAKYVSTPIPEKNLKLQQSTNIFTWPEPEQKEAKVKDPPPPVVDEVKFLRGSESFEDDEELPYVPTTLPLEKPCASMIPIFPSKEHRSGSLGGGNTNIPLQRPKVVRPPNPASIQDYIANSQKALEGIETKMKINLPRDDSLGSGCGSPAPGAGYTAIPSSADGQFPIEENNIPVVKSPRRSRGSIGATNWKDFAEMGLQSPRDIRKKLREENGDN